VCVHSVCIKVQEPVRINNWDVALFKNFFLGRLKAQFRSEVYNAFNQTQFSTFDSTA
jgi:hypothetical protein